MFPRFDSIPIKATTRIARKLTGAINALLSFDHDSGSRRPPLGKEADFEIPTRFGWGVIASAQSGTYTWRGMMACRFFLGINEAGFGPGIPYLLSFFYLRHEVSYFSIPFVLLTYLDWSRKRRLETMTPRATVF